jgi:hypothetical protein
MYHVTKNVSCKIVSNYLFMAILIMVYSTEHEAVKYPEWTWFGWKTFWNNNYKLLLCVQGSIFWYTFNRFATFPYSIFKPTVCNELYGIKVHISLLSSKCNIIVSLFITYHCRICDSLKTVLYKDALNVTFTL